MPVKHAGVHYIAYARRRGQDIDHKHTSHICIMLAWAQRIYNNNNNYSNICILHYTYAYIYIQYAAIDQIDQIQ